MKMLNMVVIVMQQMRVIEHGKAICRQRNSWWLLIDGVKPEL